MRNTRAGSHTGKESMVGIDFLTSLSPPQSLGFFRSYHRSKRLQDIFPLPPLFKYIYKKERERRESIERDHRRESA